MSIPSWAPLKRNYENESKTNSCKRTDAPVHPLLTSRAKVDVVVVNRRSTTVKGSVTDSNDPLSDPLGGSVGFDPLSGRYRLINYS